MALESQKAARLEDPGAEVLERLTGFWNRFGRFLSVGLGVTVVVAAAIFFLMRSRAAAEEQAAGSLAEANVFFWQGDYKRSLELARQVSARYPSTPSGIEAHRLAGDDAFWDGDFKTAVTEYQQYLARNKSGLLADAARRSMAYALESNSQYLDAAKLYEELVGKFDRSSSAEFLAAAARCYREAGRPAEAVERLKRIDLEFGETTYARIARVELAELTATTR